MAKLGKNSAIAYIARLLSFLSDVEEPIAVAGRLVARFGNVDSVVSADIEELWEIDGLNDSAAALLRSVGALASRRATEEFALGVEHTEEEICEHLIGLYIAVPRETIYMLVLDDENRVVAVENMGVGTVGASEVYPRKLLEVAIKNKAKSVILAHNHPHGGPTASDDDIEGTKRLISLFANAGIVLTAHYIVSGRRVKAVGTEEKKK